MAAFAEKLATSSLSPNQYSIKYFKDHHTTCNALIIEYRIYAKLTMETNHDVSVLITLATLSRFRFKLKPKDFPVQPPC